MRIKDSGGNGQDEEECSLVGCGGNHIVLATTGGADVFVAGKNDLGQLGVFVVTSDSPNSDEEAEEEISSTRLHFDRQTIPVLLELPPYPQGTAVAPPSSSSSALGSRKSPRSSSLSGVVSLLSPHNNNSDEKDDTPATTGLHQKTSASPLALTLSNRVILTKVICGFEHSLLLTETGKLLSFGMNARGECGLNSLNHVISKPAFLEGFSAPIVDVATKGYHSLCLCEDGSVWGFGANDSSQLGLDLKNQDANLPIVLAPREVHSLRDKNVDKIACGSFHSVACSSVGHTWMFGDNSSGQLGLGDKSIADIPTAVQSLDGRRVSQVSCGLAHTVVVLADQDVVLGFGANGRGQLGLGHNEDVKRPTRIETVCNSAGVRRVQCGYNSTFFWLEGEGLYACGANDHGELGLGPDVPDQWLPVRVSGVPPCKRAPSIASSTFTVILPSGGNDAMMDDEYDGGERGVVSVGSNNIDDFYGDSQQQQHQRGSSFRGGNVNSHNNEMSGATPMRRHLTSLSSDLARLLSSRAHADVSLQAGGDGGIFPVHRAVVSARCARMGKVIDAKLNDARTTDSTPIVALPKITSDTLRRLLVYLYSGSVIIDDASISEILLLIACANTLACERLFCLCLEEITSLLDDENVVLVLRETCELNLLSVKRVCMEYIVRRFPNCVSGRNRSVVEALGNNPELLAEVVGLSSPDFADACIGGLPSQTLCPLSSLEFDMEALFESGNFADVVFLGETEDDREGSAIDTSAESLFFLVHRVVLIARCPFFGQAFRALHALKEDGDAASVTLEERRRVSLVFDSTPDPEGRAVVREINKSTPQAIRAFLLYLYTDRLDYVQGDTACDVLQMACVYGLGSSRLAHECERLLRANVSPYNALDTLCVATQLARDDLVQFVLEFVVENYVECVEDREAVTECLFDFPQLGVEIMRAVGARLKQRGAEEFLKKRANPAEVIVHVGVSSGRVAGGAVPAAPNVGLLKTGKRAYGAQQGAIVSTGSSSNLGKR